MLNTFGKYDLFNELIINTGYEGVDNSYNYSMGIKYEATKDLHIGLKGDNIFDNSLDRNYYNNLVTQEQVTVPTIERRFLISMEYLF
jgi:outer membrane receptor for ferrienterochelin and colicin